MQVFVLVVLVIHRKPVTIATMVSSAGTLTAASAASAVEASRSGKLEAEAGMGRTRVLAELLLATVLAHGQVKQYLGLSGKKNQAPSGF